MAPAVQQCEGIGPVGEMKRRILACGGLEADLAGAVPPDCTSIEAESTKRSYARRQPRPDRHIATGDHRAVVALDRWRSGSVVRPGHPAWRG